jgi:hypothetical protein
MMEVLHPRCCCLDVHKDTVVACLYRAKVTVTRSGQVGRPASPSVIGCDVGAPSRTRPSCTRTGMARSGR